MFGRKPRGTTEDARIRDAVSRMAAVLVLAAGGELRIPIRLIRDEADYIELEQDDSEPDVVIYRARPFRRAAGGTILEGAAAPAGRSIKPVIFDEPDAYPPRSIENVPRDAPAALPASPAHCECDLDKIQLVLAGTRSCAGESSTLRCPYSPANLERRRP